MNQFFAPQDVFRLSQTTPQLELKTQSASFQPSAPQATPGAPLKLSLNQLCTRRLPMADEIHNLKSLGYDGIGLWRPKVSDLGEELVADLIQESGLAVSSLSFAGGFTGDSDLSWIDAIDDARHAIAQAQLVGAENLIVVSGTRNGHTARHCRRAVIKALKELAEFAMLSGVNLALLPTRREFESKWSLLNRLDDTLDVLAEVDHRSVGLAFDTYHLSGESELVRRIPEIVSLTHIVQVGDVSATSLDRCLPGEGTVPLADLVVAFQRAGYEGAFDIQAWSPETTALNPIQLAVHCRSVLNSYVKEPTTDNEVDTISPT